MITLKRQPLPALGLVPLDLNEWLTAARALRTTASVAGRLGVTVGSKQPAAPRRVTVGAAALLTSELDRLAAMARVERALLDQRIPLETADRPLVQTWVLVEAIDWKQVHPQAPKIAVPSIACQITLLALDGGSEDAEPWPPVLLSTTPAAMPVGTLPSDGTLWLWGYTSPVVLTYTPANGENPITLTIAQAATTGDSVMLDLWTADAYFTLASSGARTKITNAVVASPVGQWPAIDNRDQRGYGMVDGTSAFANPTLAVSSGSGLWIGRRRWRA